MNDPQRNRALSGNSPPPQLFFRYGLPITRVMILLGMTIVCRTWLTDPGKLMVFDVTCQEKYRADTLSKADPLTNRLLTSAHESHMVRADYHTPNGIVMMAIISQVPR